jgi:hypothetical protein
MIALLGNVAIVVTCLHALMNSVLIYLQVE